MRLEATAALPDRRRLLVAPKPLQASTARSAVKAVTSR